MNPLNVPDDKKDSFLAALYDVHDPETGLSVIDMGLIYDVAWDDATLAADVTMTLTTPHCPAGPMIVEGVRRRLERVDGVGDVRVHVTFDPPWTPERITPAGRRELGWS